MEMYATIRKESIYYHSQQEFDEGKNPIPFAVVVNFENDPWWPVLGGIGGCYTLFDVHLWIASGKKFVMLPVHSRPE